jgi:hypothetical protein
MSIALSGAAGTALGAAPSTAPIGSIGVRLVDAASAQAADPRARLYIVDHLAPGGIARHQVEVSNSTGAVAHVLLYSAAASIANGSFLGAAGHTSNDLSSRTSVAPSAVDIPAGSVHASTVTISAPRDAAPGEQYGAIWAEVSSRADPSGVVEVNRVGVRLYVSVGPGGPTAADFTIDSLAAQRSAHGDPVVVASVRNTGGRALDMAGTLALSKGPSGLNAGPFAAALGTTLAVGATEPVTVRLGADVPRGPWLAEITLRSGLVERRAQATLTFPTHGAARAVKASPEKHSAKGRVAVAALVLAVLTAGAVLLKRRTRSLSRRRKFSPC